jgi:hypothetical protein
MKETTKHSYKEPPRGWIYVMDCESMPDLVKVGKTHMDPNERAKVLSRETTSPKPHRVQFEGWFDQYGKVERRVFNKLRQFHEGKEYYRCDVATAVKAIRELNPIHESCQAEIDQQIQLERITKERIRQEQERKAAEAQAELERKQEEEARRKRVSEAANQQEKILEMQRQARMRELDYERKTKSLFGLRSISMMVALFGMLLYFK